MEAIQEMTSNKTYQWAADNLFSDASSVAELWSFEYKEERVEAKKRDYFISYKRQDGGTIAKLLHEILKNKGLDGFFDMETIGSGDWTESIRTNIITSNNFLLVVTPQVFQSEVIFKEIETARKENKNITPIFPVGISGFPENLPDNLKFLYNTNGFFFHHDNYQFDKLIANLVSRKSEFIHYCKENYWQKNEIGTSFALDIFEEMNGSEEALDFLSEKIINHWQNNPGGRKDRLVIEKMPTNIIKQYLNAHQLPFHGDRNKTVKTLKNYLSGIGEFKKDTRSKGKDRLEQVEKRLKTICAKALREEDIRLHLSDNLDDLKFYDDDFFERFFYHPNHESLSQILDSLMKAAALDIDGLKKLRIDLKLKEDCGLSRDAIRYYLDLWVNHEENKNADSTQE